MHKWLLAALLVAAAQLVGTAGAIPVDVTTPPQDGVTITTQVDTDRNEIAYTFDFAALPSDYNQIVFLPPMFPLEAIPFEYASVSAPGLTEWNLHGLWPGGTPSLELQFDQAAAPPRLTTVTIVYGPDYAFTGSFLGAPGDDNVQVTLRDPPAGVDGDVVLWAHYPELVDTTLPPTATLNGFRVVNGVRLGGDLSSIETSDDGYLVIDAAPNGTGDRFLTTTLFVATSPETSVSALDVTLELAGDGPGVRTMAWLRNLDSGLWDALGAFMLPQSDSRQAFLGVPDPNAYVDDVSGRVMLRLLTLAETVQLPAGYSLRVDEVRFEITP